VTIPQTWDDVPWSGYLPYFQAVNASVL